MKLRVSRLENGLAHARAKKCLIFINDNVSFIHISVRRPTYLHAICRGLSKKSSFNFNIQSRKGCKLFSRRDAFLGDVKIKLALISG